MTAFYDFSATDLAGEPVPFSRYRGRVVLVVNTASHCGLTPQFRGLEELYQLHRETGLVVLGFPCNQFANQEPGDATSIGKTCSLDYGVTFPMFAKVDVKGPHAHPLFPWLTSRLPGWFGRDIKWNFTKFLLGRDGTPLQRYAPLTRPSRLRADVHAAVAAPPPP
jgi:glutathione peroxidase